MATAPCEPHFLPRSGVRLTAQVGKAVWRVLLDGSTVDGLVEPKAEASVLSDRELHRVMESFRAKALALHWFGGGDLSIDASELAPRTAPLLDEDGKEVAVTPWYRIVDLSVVEPAR